MKFTTSHNTSTPKPTAPTRRPPRKESRAKKAKRISQEAIQKAHDAKLIRYIEGEDEDGQSEEEEELQCSIMDALTTVASSKLTDIASLKRKGNFSTPEAKRAKLLGNENTPENSPILRLSLEIRERIYGYLLISPKRIYTHNDWRALHQPIPLSNSILLTSRQFYIEAAHYLYRENVFTALVRGERSWLTSHKLEPRFFPWFRNVVVNCLRDDWGWEGMMRTKECVEVLVEKRVDLASFTIVLHPVAAVGIKVDASCTFANWFAEGSGLMESFLRLRCRRVRVVVVVPAIPEEEEGVGESLFGLTAMLIRSGVVKKKFRRVVVEVDVTWLGQEENYRAMVREKDEKEEKRTKRKGKGNARDIIQIDALSDGDKVSPQQPIEIDMEELDADMGIRTPTSLSPQYSSKAHLEQLDLCPFVVAARTSRRQQAIAQMRGLKELIEDIQENPDGTVLLGKCRFLQEGEL